MEHEEERQVVVAQFPEGRTEIADDELVLDGSVVIYTEHFVL